MKRVSNGGTSHMRYMLLLSCIVVLACVFSAFPISAGWEDTFSNTPAEATQFNIGEETILGGPQLNADTEEAGGYYHQFEAQWKKFTVTQPSLLTVTVTAPTPSNTGEGWYPNGIQSVDILAGDAEQILKNVDYTTIDMEVLSSSVEPTKSTMYKVLPGTYYVKAREWRSNINGYGTLTVNTVPIADDPGGEPNDKILLAKNIQLNTQYTALTGYHGHKDENNNFNQDFKDYYKFSVPANNYAVTLDISRANTNIEMDLQARIVDKNGYQIGQNISLRNASSDRIDISFSEAGTYYLFVDSWPANYQSTEYTFKLTGTNPTTITMRSRAQIGKGQTIKLNPVISPATPARTITWRSSNTSVATVETNGTVKGINSGTATITATVNGVSNVSASCVITVKQPVKSVKIKKSVKLKRGKTYVLAVKIKPADATNKNVKWKSSNKKVASVSKGVIRAKKKGRAVITVTTNDGKKKAKCKVRVTK